MRPLVLVVLAMLAPAALAAHHLNGIWKLDVVLADGQGGTATFELTETEGGELTGSYSGAAGTAPVTGSVNGANVELGFDTPAVGKVTFQGIFAEDRLSGTCDYGMAGKGTFSGTKE